MNNIKSVVLSHIYYQNIAELAFLKNKPDGIDVSYLFNVCAESFDCNEIRSSIAAEFPSSPTMITSNKGKDIGGKLALIDLSMRLNLQTDFYIFLHDKQSPHTSLGSNWREKLFRIIKPEIVSKIKEFFEKDNKIGIICAKEFIINEYDKKEDKFDGNNDFNLKELLKEYKMHLENYDFVGGTMFWIRSEIIHHFFNVYSPLEIRKGLEKGNILDYHQGTKTHAWERMLSWIAVDQGYYIKGI